MLQYSSVSLCPCTVSRYAPTDSVFFVPPHANDTVTSPAKRQVDPSNVSPHPACAYYLCTRDVSYWHLYHYCSTKTTKHPRLSCFRSFRDKDEGRLTGSPVAYLWGEAEIFSKKTSAVFLVFSRIFIDADRFCFCAPTRKRHGGKSCKAAGGSEQGLFTSCRRVTHNVRAVGAVGTR